MQKYAEYKDSGIEWIGEIPKHWKVTKIKKVTNYEIGGTPSRNKMEYFAGDNLWVSINDLNQGEIILDTKEKITQEGINNSNCKLIPKGSLLYSFKLSVGLVAFAGVDLYTNEAIASFSPESKIKLKYLRYALTVGFENNARENIYSAKLFNQRFIDNAKIISPPEEEQIIIVDFLGDKTQKIDKLIDNKKKQINLLKEQEKSTIGEVVLKGINNKIKLKNSSLDWLDKIPKKWEIKKIKKIFYEVNERSKTGEEMLLSVSEYYGVKPKKEVIEEGDFLTHAKTLEEYKICKKGDLVINIMLAWKTGLGVTKYDGIVSPAYCVFRTKQIPKYFHYLFRTKLFTTQFKRYSTGIIDSRLRLYPDKFFRISSLFPPLEEQKKIVEYLDEKTSKIQRLIKLMKQEILKLEEYKKILINDAVTGKIKVGA